MATSYLTQPGGGYATDDKEIQAKLIAMGARGASPDSQTQTMAVSRATPGVIVPGATSMDPRGFQTQFQSLTSTGAPSRYNSDGSLNTAAPGTAPAPQTTASPVPVMQSATPGAPSFNVNPTLSRDEYLSQFGPAKVDEESIREQVRKENQARIDAINTVYDDMVRSRAVVNDANLGSVRGINARSGNFQSDFGGAKNDNQRMLNDKATAAINAERSLQVSSVYRDISKLASDEIAAKKAEALGQADAYKGYLNESQTKSQELAKTLGTAGLSFDEFKQQAPDQLKTLLKNSGYDEFTLATIMNNNKKAAEKIDYTYKTVGNKVIGYGLNPKTGQIETIEKDIPGEDAQNLQDYTPHTLADGTLVFTPKQIDPTKSLKDQVLMYGTEGQFAKETPVKPITKIVGKILYTSLDDGKTWQRAAGVAPATSGSSSGSKAVKVSTTSAAKDMTSQLSKVIGSDGFISPVDYTKARNEWITAGLNPTAFDTQFKGFRNPNNPNYVINKESATGF